MSNSSFSQAIAALADSIRRYLEVRVNLAKLHIMEQAARIISLLVAALLFFILMMLFLLFISIAAANWIGELLDSMMLGYFIVAGFQLLLGILVFSFRRRLFLNTVIRHLSEIFFEDEKKTKDEEE